MILFTALNALPVPHCSATHLIQYMETWEACVKFPQGALVGFNGIFRMVNVPAVDLRADFVGGARGDMWF